MLRHRSATTPTSVRWCSPERRRPSARAWTRHSSAVTASTGSAWSRRASAASAPSPTAPGRWSPPSTAPRSPAASRSPCSATCGLAAEAASFGFPELPRGIPPSYAAARAALPAPVAAELTLTGRLLDADGALRMGIVGRRPPGRRADAAGDRAGGRIASGPRQAIAETKRRILLDRDRTIGHLFEEEERLLREALLGDESRRRRVSWERLRLIRHSFPDQPELSTAVSRTILRRVAAGELPPTIRIHRPGNEVAFGRQDLASPRLRGRRRGGAGGRLRGGRAPRRAAARPSSTSGTIAIARAYARPAASEAHLRPLRGDGRADRRRAAGPRGRRPGRRGARRVLPGRLQRQRARRGQALRHRPAHDPRRRPHGRGDRRLRRPAQVAPRPSSRSTRRSSSTGIPRPRADVAEELGREVDPGEIEEALIAELGKQLRAGRRGARRRDACGGPTSSAGRLQAVKLLAFSDLHRDLGQAGRLVERSSEADVVIAAGDFASVHEGLEETIDAAAADLRAHRPRPRQQRDRGCAARRLRGLGRGDRPPRPGDGDRRDAVLRPRAPGSRSRPGTGASTSTRTQAAEKLADCPEDAVLVVHSPPKGHCDQSSAGDHLGSQAILEAIEAKRPQLAVCGHIHESWGAESEIGPTRVHQPRPGRDPNRVGRVNDWDQAAARPRRVARRGRARRGAQRRHAERRAPPPPARQRGAQAARRQRDRDARRPLRLHLRLARGVCPGGRARRQEPDAGREARRAGPPDALAPGRRGVEGRLGAAPRRRGGARRGDARGRARGIRGGPALRRVPVGGRHRPSPHPRRPGPREEAARRGPAR